MARKTAAAPQRCHECLSVEEKTSSNTSCFSSVTREEKEAEVGGMSAWKNVNLQLQWERDRRWRLNLYACQKLEKVLHRFKNCFPFFVRVTREHSLLTLDLSPYRSTYLYFFTDKKVTRQPCQHRLQELPILNGSMDREYRRLPQQNGAVQRCRKQVKSG